MVICFFALGVEEATDRFLEGEGVGVVVGVEPGVQPAEYVHLMLTTVVVVVVVTSLQKSPNNKHNKINWRKDI